MLPDVHVLTMPKAFTDDEFFEFCVANRELQIERDAKGQIWIMSPTGNKTGYLNTELTTEISNWNRKHKLGRVFDSSTGFTLPNGAMRSPDVAWLSSDKWKGLSEKEKEKFARVCPEFIVELRSPSDSLTTLQTKMEEWIENGVELGWLIDPVEERVHIYQPERPVGTVESFNTKVSGLDVMPGFELDLNILLE